MDYYIMYLKGIVLYVGFLDKTITYHNFSLYTYVILLLEYYYLQCFCFKGAFNIIYHLYWAK